MRVNPKPVHDRRIPIVLGGNSDAALRRVAAWRDGWYGFNLESVDPAHLPPPAAADWVSTLADRWIAKRV